MAALSDSRWVAEDLLAGAVLGTPFVVTQDVAAYTVDVNDPSLDSYSGFPSGQGYRTGFLLAAPAADRTLAIDTSASDYPVAVFVFEVDPATGYQFGARGDNPVAYDYTTGRVTVHLHGGVTYLIEAAQITDDGAHTALSMTFTARAYDRTAAGMLLTGIGGPTWSLRTPFDLGGPGTALLVTPFDLLYLPLPTSRLVTPFDLIGAVGSQIVTPFDLGTSAGWYLETPFDILELAPVPAVGILPTPPPLLPGQTPGPAPAFIPGFAVYSKAGIYIGSITKWDTAAARSISLGQAGNLQFSLPGRKGYAEDNPELDLIQLDRLVVAGNNMGTPPWGGTITAREWTNSRLSVTADDLFALATGMDVGDPSASVDETQTPNPSDSYAMTQYAKRLIARSGQPAAALVASVMAQVNQFQAAAGEALWEVDATGTHTFFGDENISGDALSCLGLIADRSFCEFGWTLRVEANRVVPILVWRDAFTAPAGVDLTDGPGGNVSDGAIYRETSQPIINAIRLTGSVTSIQSKIPDGAQALPVQERIPVAEVWLDPGPYRRRTNLGQSAGVKVYITVPFSFPADTQKAAADAAAAAQMKLFEQYVAAVHDQLGQPYHSEGFNASGGWAWAGPGEEIPVGSATFGERYLVWGDWVHTRYLAQGPSSVTMIGQGKYSGRHIRVLYDRLTGTQSVGVYSAVTPVDDPTKVYDFERYYFSNWDPRRDGIGVQKQVKTVRAGAVVTETRWRIVSWNQTDQNWSTQISSVIGLSPTATTVVVQSTLGAPPFPFEADIGGYETVLVTGGVGSQFTIVRGQKGTTGVIHEPGESFTYTAPPTDGTTTTTSDPALPPLYVPWPEGVAYATRLLAKLSKPVRILSVPVVNRNGDWATIAMGSTHAINVQTEGPTGGIVIGSGRVIGYAPDEVKGTMEVVLEVIAP